MTKKYDLHTHSIFSPDSITPVEKLCERYVALGLSGFALTDHGSIDGWKQAKDYIHKKKLPLDFIPACEFVTTKGDIIGLYLSDMIYSRDPLEIIDSIHSQGGLVILPHPFDGIRGSACHPDKLGKEGVRKLDGIETFNARAGKGANERAAAFASGHSLAQTGGSDTHFLFEAGNGYTCVPSGMGLEKAIRAKKTSGIGSLSPIYVHGPTTLVKFGKKLGFLPKP